MAPMQSGCCSLDPSHMHAGSVGPRRSPEPLTAASRGACARPRLADTHHKPHPTCGAGMQEPEAGGAPHVLVDLSCSQPPQEGPAPGHDWSAPMPQPAPQEGPARGHDWTAPIPRPAPQEGPEQGHTWSAPITRPTPGTQWISLRQALGLDPMPQGPPPAAQLLVRF